MSVITAIFQAIAQAFCRILPISESGHSGLFHNFAGRYSGACSALTGIVHIGVAIGIVLASYGLFLRLGKELFGTVKDLTHKKLKGSSQDPGRSFFYMLLISFLPMILWAVPTGKGTVYSLLSKTGSNSSVIDEGIFLAITGVLVLLTVRQLQLARNNGNVSVLNAVVVGMASVFLVPISGLSLTAGVFAALMLFGVSKKLAYRYVLALSVPVLLVTGIVEICVAVTPAKAVTVILGLIFSVVAAFVATRLLKYIVEKNYLKYFGIYDLALGAIAFVIGVFQLILK